MKTLSQLKALIVAILISHVGMQSQTPPPQPIPAKFFSVTKNWFQPWPSIPVTSLRLWNTSTDWADINPSKGVYYWTVLDKWIAAGQSKSADLILTMAGTPAWASSNRNDSNCRYGSAACAPPNDLNSDGTGTDQHWKDFVTAVVKHAAGRIKFWEIWNEPAWTIHWTGTPAQMVRMTRDAYTIIHNIDPNAKILAPGNQALTSFHMKWWNSFAAAGGLKYVDIIALHGYTNYYPLACNVYPRPELISIHSKNLRTLLAAYGQSSKPLWDTEGSWGDTNRICLSDPNLQAAWVARSLLVHWSQYVTRFYWYQWQGPTGGLATSSNTLLKPGVAFQQLRQWLIGATMTTSCSALLTTWTCNFSRPGGYVARAVWDTSQTCSNGTCTTIGYKIGTQWKHYRTLSGSVVTVSGTMVPIGIKPILLENR
ncbi:MAG: hypothetical protein DMG74_20155 [Acidobacteria bacterium]|nr:MAG: hypothetical protein DMG74_20155 [Acidobacteriota bacterium]